MKSAALANGSGPGSSIALSPTSIRVRDAIIEKFIDKSLDELNNFLTSALDTERDESKRIGILAARVYILRTRISKIMEFNQNSMIPAIDTVTPQELVNKPQHFDEPATDDKSITEGAFEEWNELMTIEAGEVNGVRIPSGVAITVGRDDAARLIETGKAKLITEEGSTEKPLSEQDSESGAPEIQEMDTEEVSTENPLSEKEPDSGASEIQEMDTEEGFAEKPFSEQAPEMQETDTEEGSTEKPLSEQDSESDATEVQEMDTEDKTEPTSQMLAELTEETTAGDAETNLQESSSTKDTPTLNGDEDKTDETKTQT